MILFRVDANAHIGYGHFYRSLALSEMLSMDFPIIFAMSNPVAGIRRILTDSKIKLIELPSYDYTTPDERGTSEIPFDLEEHLDNISVVVLDGYWFGAGYQKYLSNHPAKVAVIEDKGGGKYYCDLVINQAPLLNKKSYSLRSEQPLFALGPDFALLRRAFLESARNESREIGNLNQVLLCFGGSDYYNLTARVAKVIINETNLVLHVVLGHSYLYKDSLTSLMEKHPDRFFIYTNLTGEEIAEKMKGVDIGVFPSSGILYESIAIRLPVISGSYTDNQANMYHGLKEYGVFVDAHNFEEEHIRSAFGKVNRGLLKEITSRQAGLIDGHSEKRYRVMFERLVYPDFPKVRKAKYGDIQQYFEWACDPTVRANALSNEPLVWENHLAWFRKKISSKRSLLLVIYSSFEIGQIRFDEDDKGYWVIDYSIDKLFRGMGLGLLTVRKGVQHLLSEIPERKIKAEVKPENSPSIQVFRKMGFDESVRDGMILFTN
ncbi:MAG: UDP-2,4-diacetamido-2,4,6-trideoxy-beta-L-altropyranose hydrolase [Bacteroidota bacterium]